MKAGHSVFVTHDSSTVAHFTRRYGLQTAIMFDELLCLSIKPESFLVLCATVARMSVENAPNAVAIQVANSGAFSVRFQFYGRYFQIVENI